MLYLASVYSSKDYIVSGSANLQNGNVMTIIKCLGDKAFASYLPGETITVNETLAFKPLTEDMAKKYLSDMDMLEPL